MDWANMEGSVATGVVKNLTEYGAFIDLGGIDGLLHVTDMSYGRITHPQEMLHVGDEITALHLIVNTPPIAICTQEFMVVVGLVEFRQ